MLRSRTSESELQKAIHYLISTVHYKNTATLTVVDLKLETFMEKDEEFLCSTPVLSILEYRCQKMTSHNLKSIYTYKFFTAPA